MEDKRKNPLDDLFRCKLNEEQLEPDNQLWNEIEQELQQKEKPNRRILFILFGVLLLAGVTGWYFINGNKNSTNGNVTAENVKTISAPAESAVTVQTETSADKNSNTIPSNNNSSITADNNSASASSTENPNSSNSNSSSKNNSYKSISTNQNKTGNTNSTVTLASEPEKKNEVESIAVSNNTTESINSVSASTDLKNSSTQQTNETTVSNDNAETVKQNDLKPANEEKTNPNATTVSNPENEIVKTEGNQPENTLPVKTDSTVSAVTLPTNDPVTLKTQQPIKWYIGAGTSYLTHSSSIKSDSGYYFSRRNDEESSISNFNYSIHFGAIINHLQLQSGIGIYKPGEKINYNNIGTCLSLKSTGYYLPDSTFIYQYDSTYRISKNDSLVLQNGIHTNSYLTIPIEVYYNFPVNKMDVQIGGGLSSAFPLKWNSVYINQQVTQLENPSDLKMLNPVVLNLNLNLGIAIPVYKNLSVVLDAEYRKNLNSVFKKSYSVNQKYQSVGAGVGVRYNFTKK